MWFQNWSFWFLVISVQRKYVFYPLKESRWSGRRENRHKIPKSPQKGRHEARQDFEDADIFDIQKTQEHSNHPEFTHLSAESTLKNWSRQNKLQFLFYYQLVLISRWWRNMIFHLFYWNLEIYQIINLWNFIRKSAFSLKQIGSHFNYIREFDFQWNL